MSDGDVHGNEMNAPHDFDDAATEALLAGSGRDVAPELADLVADVRVAFTSSPPPAGPALAAFLTAANAVPGPTSRRFDRMMKSTMIAKIGAATAAVVAATGGLAMASALPAPMQDAVSHLGVGAPAHHSHAQSTVDVSPADTETTTSVDPTATTEPELEPTTVPGDTPSTTVESGDNHGDAVSSVAHDDNNDGCEHGRAVSNVASGGAAQGQPCPTTSTTVGDGTTPPTIADDSGDGPDTHQGDGKNKHNGTTDTTVGNGTTPTTMDGGGDNGGSSSGDHGASGGDHGGGN